MIVGCWHQVHRGSWDDDSARRFIETGREEEADPHLFPRQLNPSWPAPVGFIIYVRTAPADFS